MAATNLSEEDKKFLAQCEEEFKDRYTEKDEEFMKVYNSEPSEPPIIENWLQSRNYGRNDRNNWRGRSDYRGRSYRDKTERSRGYNDYQDYDGNRKWPRYN